MVWSEACGGDTKREIKKIPVANRQDHFNKNGGWEEGRGKDRRSGEEKGREDGDGDTSLCC